MGIHAGRLGTALRGDVRRTASEARLLSAGQTRTTNFISAKYGLLVFRNRFHSRANYSSGLWPKLRFNKDELSTP